MSRLKTLYLDLMTETREGKIKRKKGLEGLVISEENDINLILRTEEITLPDLSEIKSILQVCLVSIAHPIRCNNS